MNKSKEEKIEEIKTISAQIPEIAEGKAMKIVNINGDYVLTDLNNSEMSTLDGNYVEQATYDMSKFDHIYNKVLDKEQTSFVTNIEEIKNLAKNTQTSMRKVQKINGIAKYYINKEDLIGRVVETIENNINVNYKVNYPKVNKKGFKGYKAMFKNMSEAIDEFNKQINIPNLIAENALSTYTEGNYIYYLMGDKNKGYSIVNYPLGIVEITDMMVDGEPVIAFNVNELTARINKNKAKYGKLKSNKKIKLAEIIENEIKRDYPEEVYDAYVSKDSYAFLDPERVGVSRINNLKGLYGVTPIFKSLSSQLMLDTLDFVDRKNLLDKARKVYFQKTRKELMGKDYTNPMQVNPVGYAHTSLLTAMQDDTIVYTGMPFVESLEILEPKSDVTEANTVLSYRQRVLNALGISFLSGDSKNSVSTISVNYSEILRLVNRVTKQLEPVINKYYQLICEENGFPIELAPTINVESTELIDMENKLKLVETLYSKIGISYKSILEMLDLDFETEKSRREEENKDNLDEDVFYPHITSFTVSGKEGDVISNNDKKTNSNGSAKSENLDKQEYDQDHQKETNV
jgi:hypothetical protein